MFMQSIQNALHELFKKKNPYQDVFQHFSNTLNLNLTTIYLIKHKHTQ